MLDGKASEAERAKCEAALEEQGCSLMALKFIHSLEAMQRAHTQPSAVQPSHTCVRCWHMALCCFQPIAMPPSASQTVVASAASCFFYPSSLHFPPFFPLLPPPLQTKKKKNQQNKTIHCHLLRLCRGSLFSFAGKTLQSGASLWSKSVKALTPTYGDMPTTRIVDSIITGNNPELTQVSQHAALAPRFLVREHVP